MFASQEYLKKNTYMTEEKKTQVAIIGAGPGGYPAAFRAADLGLEVTIIDPEADPGGVCLYRGCIPSKALLHAAKVITEAEEASRFGVSFEKPVIDLDKLRGWKDDVVGKLVGGLGQDRLFGLGGPDVLSARDGHFDFLAGGSGFDRARIDLLLDEIRDVEKLLP